MTARRTLRLSCQAQQQQQLVDATPEKTVLGFVGIGIMGLAMVRPWGSWANRRAPGGAWERWCARGATLAVPFVECRGFWGYRACRGKPVCVLLGSFRVLLDILAV